MKCQSLEHASKQHKCQLPTASMQYSSSMLSHPHMKSCNRQSWLVSMITKLSPQQTCIPAYFLRNCDREQPLQLRLFDLGKRPPILATSVGHLDIGNESAVTKNEDFQKRKPKASGRSGELTMQRKKKQQKMDPL